MPDLPAAFQTQMHQLLGQNAPRFFESLTQTPPVSIRLNPTKTKNLTPKGAPIPWCTRGFYLPERPVFTLDPAFQGGAYYVQEAHSMSIERAFKGLFPNPSGLNVLDLCAAPGGKSTHLLSLLPNDCLLVANEVIRSRAKILRNNLWRWGQNHCAVTSLDPVYFGRYEGVFDLLITDVPCSGEGLFRRDPEAITHWSPEQVQHAAQRQKRILADIWPALKEGGLLFYSTCTYNTLENEALLEWICQELGAQRMPVPELNQEPALSPETGLWHFYPHLSQGEGFTLGVLQKTSRSGQWKPRKKGAKLGSVPTKERTQLTPWLAQIEAYVDGDDIFALSEKLSSDQRGLLAELPTLSTGLPVGKLGKKGLIPNPALAFSPDLSKAVSRVSLSYKQAQQLLNKTLLDVDAPKGWHLATHQGIGLAWIKKMPGRINNYYPTPWRILMDLKEQAPVLQMGVE